MFHRRRREFHDEEAMSAMNDIMFFLMLFFLIISTLSNPNVIKLTLPKSSESNVLPKMPITVSITEDKTFYLNNDKVDPFQMEAALKDALSKTDDKTVVLRMAKNLTIQDQVDILAIGSRAQAKFVMSTVK